MKTIGDFARELFVGTRRRKTRVLLAIAVSVVLAACPEPAPVNDVDVETPFLDNLPPELASVVVSPGGSSGLDFNSGEAQTFTLEIVDQINGQGVDENSVQVSCSAGMSVLAIRTASTNSFNGFNYDVDLQAPVVNVDTPYECDVTAQDNGSNRMDDSFVGIIFGGGVPDTDPPVVAVTSSTSFNSDTTGTVTVEVTDASSWELTVGSCTEGASAQINGSNTTSPVDVDIDVPAVGVDTNFSCPLEATDSEGNTTTASID